MTPDIQFKLERFFNERLPFTEEWQIVYLLVEIRKILDRGNNRKYPLLRFYADWAVHTAKDRINSEIKTIMERILDEIKKANQTGVEPLNFKSQLLSVEVTHCNGLCRFDCRFSSVPFGALKTGKS